MLTVFSHTPFSRRLLGIRVDQIPGTLLADLKRETPLRLPGLCRRLDPTPGRNGAEQHGDRGLAGRDHQLGDRGRRHALAQLPIRDSRPRLSHLGCSPNFSFLLSQFQLFPLHLSLPGNVHFPGGLCYSSHRMNNARFEGGLSPPPAVTSSPSPDSNRSLRTPEVSL